MSVNDILDVGQRGLQTQRQSLSTTSNNIANANTPGYSRQKTQLVNLPAQSINGLTIGSGVEVKKVIRVHDEFVQKQLVDENQNFGNSKIKAETLNRFEALATQEGSNLSETINRFFNDFRELSNNVENPSLRNVVHGSAQSLVRGFKQMNDSLELGRRELDLRVGDVANQINVNAREIADLNSTIVQSEARGETPNELYDRRDMLIRDLAQKVDLQVTEDQRGQKTILAGNAVIVQGADHFELTVRRSAAEGERAAGSMSVFINGSGVPREITHSIKNGELGGLMQARDHVINPAMRHLDKIAYQVTKKVNEIHSEGMGLDGVSNRNFFKELGDEVEHAAFKFGLSDEINENHEKIATGFGDGAPGDNRAALAIADIQNEKFLPAGELGGTVLHSVNESLNNLVAQVGISTQHETQMFEHQRAIVDQLENYRQSYSGVSLEEEAVDMIKYQTVFNASAKAMKVGEDLLDTILSLKD
ncbi:MAG: flagellar hook-associated protein FlgK [Proteobacteria bacterium]|nr:flagellar hook-associated protein FlgK [Pseudomonadota bacterium]